MLPHLFTRSHYLKAVSQSAYLNLDFLLLAAFFPFLSLAWIPLSFLVFQLLLQKSHKKYFPASGAALKHCNRRACNLLTVLLVFCSVSAKPASSLTVEWTDVWRGVGAARSSVKCIRGQIQCKMSNQNGSIYPSFCCYSGCHKSCGAVGQWAVGTCFHAQRCWMRLCIEYKLESEWVEAALGPGSLAPVTGSCRSSYKILLNLDQVFSRSL